MERRESPMRSSPDGEFSLEGSTNCALTPARSCILSASMALFSVVCPAFAEDESPAVTAQDSRPTIEEVIVTAQKREESLQDTPVAVTRLYLSSHRGAGYRGHLGDRRICAQSGIRHHIAHQRAVVRRDRFYSRHRQLRLQPHHRPRRGHLCGRRLCLPVRRRCARRARH